MKYKVAIGIPVAGDTQPESFDNLLLFAQWVGSWDKEMELKNTSPRYEFYWYSTGRILTAFAREKLVEEAIKARCDYILMIDNDMLLPPAYVKNMFKNLQEHPEIDILAPLAFMRNPPHFPVIYSVTEGYDANRGTTYYTNNVVKNYPKDQLIECDAVGFGSVLINMRILKKMSSPFFMSTTGSGEDIWFCNKARSEADARIFVDTRIKLGHLGNPIIIDEEFAEKHWKGSNQDMDEDKPYKYSKSR